MNVVKAPFTKGSHKVETAPLWQYDYGQILEVTGLDLPSSYEVHFANDPTGAATTALGNENGVSIPDIYLTKGDVYAWIYLHTGEDDGETVYQIKIPVRARASISDQPPTPVQQSIIEQAITALNAGVAQVEELAEGIPTAIDTALQEAKDSGEFDGKDGKDGKDGQDGAPGADGKDGKDGADGAPGQDGVSPIATVTKSGKVATITITDANGTTTETVSDGEDGDPTTLIDDNSTAANKVWSAEKSTSLLSAIQQKYTLPSDGIPSSDMASAVQTSLGKADTAYQKPLTGIPSTDLESGVQTSLGKADTAYQKPSGGIPASDLASGVVPGDWRKICDDTTTEQLSKYTISTDENGDPFVLEEIMLIIISAQGSQTVGYVSFYNTDNIKLQLNVGNVVNTGNVRTVVKYESVADKAFIITNTPTNNYRDIDRTNVQMFNGLLKYGTSTSSKVSKIEVESTFPSGTQFIVYGK